MGTGDTTSFKRISVDGNGIVYTTISARFRGGPKVNMCPAPTCDLSKSATHAVCSLGRTIQVKEYRRGGVKIRSEEAITTSITIVPIAPGESKIITRRDMVSKGLALPYADYQALRPGDSLGYDSGDGKYRIVKATRALKVWDDDLSAVVLAYRANGSAVAWSVKNKTEYIIPAGCGAPAIGRTYYSDDFERAGRSTNRSGASSRSSSVASSIDHGHEGNTDWGQTSEIEEAAIMEAMNRKGGGARHVTIARGGASGPWSRGRRGRRGN